MMTSSTSRSSPSSSLSSSSSRTPAFLTSFHIPHINRHPRTSTISPTRHRHHPLCFHGGFFSKYSLSHHVTSIPSFTYSKDLSLSTTASIASSTTTTSTATSLSASASSSASTSIVSSSITTAPASILTIMSTIVGVFVVIGSILYKIPQVVRIIRRRSAAGISVLMYALETIGTTFSALYFARRAFPFSTYGETVFIITQNIILLALIVFYNDLPRIPAIILAVLYFSVIAALISPLVPFSLLVTLQFCSIPILNLARVPQILLNFKRKATGELSPITLGVQLLGNVARIFTTMAQVRDPLMFAGICVATCFNATLFFQWLYYSRRSKQKLVSE